MKINLSPRNRFQRLTASKSGDILTLNGEAFDFSQIPDGATLPADAIDSEWITGDVSRVNGEIELTLLLPHGEVAPKATRFPEPILNPPDGEIALPAYDSESETV